MTANDYRRLYGLPMVCYWFGKPIQNVDQRNEAIAHARAEIEKLEAEEREDPFAVFVSYHRRRMIDEKRDAIRALEECVFINPNEGMLL